MTEKTTAAFVLLPPVKGKMTCLHCGAHADVYPLGQNPHPGFGSWGVTRDEEWVGGDIHDSSTPMQKYESMAARDPDHDWRLSIQGPLWEGVYQRHGAGQWVLVEQGEGFA